MGSDWGEFWRRILRFSWFGHQSLFDLIPIFVVPCTTGHLPAFSSVFASLFPSDRVPVFFERLLEAPGMRSEGNMDAKTDEKARSEEHTSELQSLTNLACRLLLQKKYAL